VPPSVPPPPPPSSPTPSAPPSSFGSGDDTPCFAREVTTVCRLLHENAEASAAYGDCFGPNAPASSHHGEKVLAAELMAGDLVLSSPSEATRVLVNQHRAIFRASPTITIKHSHGSLSLTPDHVLWVDGAFVPARHVRVGSLLEPHSTVLSVGESILNVINPVTVNSRILVAGLEGQPVISSTHPEWVAASMLNAPVFPLRFTHGLAYTCPSQLQRFYDDLIEPVSGFAVRQLIPVKHRIPTILQLLLAFALDFAGFFAFFLHSLASVHGLVGLSAVAFALKVTGVRRGCK